MMSYTHTHTHTHTHTNTHTQRDKQTQHGKDKHIHTRTLLQENNDAELSRNSECRTWNCQNKQTLAAPSPTPELFSRCSASLLHSFPYPLTPKRITERQHWATRGKGRSDEQRIRKERERKGRRGEKQKGEKRKQETRGEEKR